MADDVIRLNLTLNESTVQAVENRVRNIVSRLNNQAISLNINGTNLDNIINRLNVIYRTMGTINNTPVNINANLTQAQQQYRLETERLRVSQQLEISRQRTLQTENQALTALAQQNRTLNINNRVTHQVEQGVQNVGNHMQIAGENANDFVTYLSNGVRYLIVYRSLFSIINEISKSFKEMKDVDTALVNVRKTTGMSEEEIEKIRKASYGVATEYGRVASEYLESVSEFARGGYKELSTELGKVSLLTQNVGDVSSSSANKMLLAVDSAYQLKGNVESLTDVVNGLNNIANLNPTSMQKMADGLQVSASMAQVAGLEISDLVALIGTGTAVTQREGAEISRAIRTVLMNIREVKGELDDGTIIDDESIAKAEKALNGVGIATKEIVNGTRELRDPMDILDELSEKWASLNTEAQSVLLEGIADKRQANVLAGILSNWDMVKKMQTEYFDSANSAIKENQLYLDSWEAKSARVSARWTEYVSNIANTSLIKYSLDALYGVISALDTPIGRLATQIVMVNAALAVSGRLWGAVRARSIVADILAMGVAERSLGTAIQLVTSHLAQQALAWASTPAGIVTITAVAITGLAKAYDALTISTEEAREKAEKSAQELSDLQSEIATINSELETTGQKIDEILAKDKIDPTDEEALKKLREQNDELERELRIKEALEKQAKKDASDAATEVFTSVPDNGVWKTRGTTVFYEETRGAGGVGKYQDVDRDRMQASLDYMNQIVELNKEIDSLQKEQDKYAVDSTDFNLIQNKINSKTKVLVAVQKALDTYIGEFQTDDDNLVAGISEETDNILAMLDDIYAKYDMLMNYTDGTAITLSERLQDKFAHGTDMSDGSTYSTSSDMDKQISSWINTLSEEDKKIMLSCELDNASLEELKKYLAEQKRDIEEDATPEITDLGISEMVSEINTKLKPAMDSLSDAWNDIFTEDGFTLENVDVSMLDSIKSTVDDLNEMEGISIDYSSFENLAKVLTNTESTATDVENSMDEFATAILNGVSSTKELDSSTAQMVATLLESIGVSNAQEIVFAKLNAQTEALALQEQFATQHGIELANASNDIVAGFLNQAGATETARMYLFQLVSAEQIFNNQDLNTAEKIAELKELATAYGQTAIAARIANLEKASADGHIPIDYEKELNALQTDINNAVNNVKVDFTPITKASGKAGKDAAEEYKKALEKELSDLGNVIGHIGDIIGDQIDLFNEQKDAAVDALEAQKKAAEEALEAEKDLVQAQIDAIQAKIDAKQKEIDAINEASEERKREIELQKAQFDLLRQQNQKTVLLYKDGQMQYDTDLFGIRDARESVTQAKESIKIAGIEKEISTLETEIKGLEDVIDSLDEKIENSNKYYDSLIESTEKYWDGVIKGLEDYKSRWDELKEIEERAEMEVIFNKLGISTEEVLNMSDSAFQAFKEHYLALLTEIHSGSDEMVTALKEVADSADFAPLDKSLQTTKENIDNLGKTDLSSVSTGLSNTASSAETLNTNTEGVDENLSGISDSLNTMPESTKVSNLATAFKDLATEIKNVADALGIGTDESVSGLVQALTEISELSLGDADKELGIIAQFGNLKAKVDEVTNAISGGGSSSASSKGNNNAASGVAQAGLNANAESGSANSLTGAIEEMAQKAEESLGNGGEDSEEGTIGKFNALKTAVQNVIDLIGTEANTSGSAEGAENLISAIQLQYDRATEILPLEKLLFEELLTTIDKCVVSLNKMVSAFNSIAELGGMPTLPNGGGGGSHSSNSGSSYGGGGHSRGYAEGTVGKAFANGTGGYNGLPHDEKNALRSEYGQPELTVYPNGDVEYTDTPTMSDLPRNTIIFNEEQTKRIMNNKGTVLGNAYADGNVVLKKVEIPSYLRPLQEGDKGYELTQKFLAYQDKLASQIIPPVTAIERNMEMLTKNISNVNTNTVNKPTVNVGGITVNCPNVNSKEIAMKVSTELEKAVFGMSNYAYQKSSITR